METVSYGSMFTTHDVSVFFVFIEYNKNENQVFENKYQKVNIIYLSFLIYQNVSWEMKANVECK